MHPKINFLLLIPSFQRKSMKTNSINNVIHFHGCEVKAPKAKFYASFKCFFHYFKSSAEAILLKEPPPPAVKQHFWQTCHEFPSSYVISLTERLRASLHFWGRFFLIQSHFVSKNTTRPHVCNLQVTSLAPSLWFSTCFLDCPYFHRSNIGSVILLRI